MSRAAAVLFLGLTGVLWADERGKILRPVEGAAIGAGDLSIVARAPNGRLELDGREVTPERPFPGVFHARATPAPGAHTLALVWDTGRHEVRFFVGPGAPAEFKPYRAHPPAAVGCTQCHGLSKRGRFRFAGGCFACHATATFASTHSHTQDVLTECGECHNAHGSTEQALLQLPREKACKLCHN